MERTVRIIADIIGRRIARGRCVVCGQAISSFDGPVCHACYVEYEERRQMREYVMEFVARQIYQEFNNR